MPPKRTLHHDSTTIYFAAGQREGLKSLQKELGTSVSYLVRLALDGLLNRAAKLRRQERLTMQTLCDSVGGKGERSPATADEPIPTDYLDWTRA